MATPATYRDCPECSAANTIPMTDGTRLCIECRHEWNPAQVRAVRPNADVEHDTQEPNYGELADELQAAIDGGYTGPPQATAFDNELVDIAADIAHAIELARARFVGRRVHVHDRNDDAEVVAITDEGLAVVQYASGFSEDLDPDDFSVYEPEPEATEPTDDVIRAIGETTLAVAAHIIRAASASFIRDDDGRRLGVPPYGYLPNDPEVMPLIEQAAAYAVAVLVYAFDVPDDELDLIAARIVLTETPTPETEGANNGNEHAGHDNIDGTRSETDQPGRG